LYDDAIRVARSFEKGPFHVSSQSCPDCARASGDATNDPGARPELTGKERVLCLNAVDGKESRPRHASQGDRRLIAPAAERRWRAALPKQVARAGSDLA